MRASRPICALLLLACTATAAPAPVPRAKSTLEALKKRLPKVLQSWAKEYLPDEVIDWGTGKQVVHYVPVLRRARTLAADEARLTIHVQCWNGGSDKPEPRPAAILTVFLKYHDGLWTALRYEYCGYESEYLEIKCRRGAGFLMDAIDEAAEK